MLIFDMKWVSLSPRLFIVTYRDHTAPDHISYNVYQPSPPITPNSPHSPPQLPTHCLRSYFHRLSMDKHPITPISPHRPLHPPTHCLRSYFQQHLSTVTPHSRHLKIVSMTETGSNREGFEPFFICFDLVLLPTKIAHPVFRLKITNFVITSRTEFGQQMRSLANCPRTCL